MRSPTLSIRCSPHAKDLFDEANAIILEPIPAMAAKNKCLAQMNKSGTAVIIATHDITLMEQYDARRMVLHQGRLHIYD